MWAGTHGTPSAGSGSAGAAGSCGPTPAADTLPGGSYQYSLGYDTLDRFTTGPLGSASYADPAHLHAVTSEGTNYYTAAYDAAGNMVCRAENTAAGTCAGSTPASWTGAALGWDTAGRLVSWQNTPTNPSSTDAFAYDGEGQRVWQQSGSGSSTSTTVYVGANLVDYTYSGTAGTSTGHTNRYELPGGIGLLGVRGGSSVHLLLTDHLGTPVVQLDAASGAVQNELLTQPYGRYRYAATTLYTEAFTGQRRDTTPDVMYFNARYYDQQSGAFLSADTLLDGLNRYAYVGGNPESATDPSGHVMDPEDDPGSGEGEGEGDLASGSASGAPPSAGETAGAGSSSSTVVGGNVITGTMTEPIDGKPVQVTMSAAPGEDGTVTYTDPTTGDTVTENASDFFNENQVPQSDRPEDYKPENPATQPANPTNPTQPSNPTEPASTQSGNPTEPISTQPSNPTEPTATEPTSDDPQNPAATENTDGTNDATNEQCGESFRADTLVATPQGERAIGSLRVGNQVEAYDPMTDTTSVQTVQHVFIDHDTDLLDLTLRPTQRAESVREQTGGPADGSRRDDQRQSQRSRQRAGKAQDEVVHTTASHPWLTADRGWQRAGVLYVGEQVVTANSGTATVVALHVLPGAANMWDLTVSNMHTFVVGSGTYVVHNCPAPDDDQARGRSAKRSDRMIKQVANRKGINARAFGDYVEAMKKGGQKGTLNSYGDFTWDELNDLADDYKQEGGS